MMKRQAILTNALILCCTVTSCAGNNKGASRPTVGVIRWDAFYGVNNVTKAVEKSLGPSQYHHRAPFFAKKTGKDSLSINGDSDEVIGKEIDYAAEAGVYWAFLTYPYKSGLSIPLKRYLEHPKRRKINFNLIMSRHSLIKEWDAHFKAVLLDSVSRPNYQTVLNGRPLVYFFDGKTIAKEKIAEVRTLIANKTGKNPYLVLLMHGIPVKEWPTYKAMGYDGATKYAQFASKPLKWTQFHAQIVKDWKSWASKGVQFSPLLSAGWDNRPRYYNPVPWIEKKEIMLKRYAENPTADQLASHFKAGMDFVYKHKKVCEAQNLLMYAWNEYDEGGWLCPTLNPTTGKPDDSRVKAVGEMMRNWTPPKR